MCTEQKHSQEYEALRDCIPGGVLKRLNDEDLTIVEMNQGFLEITGFTSEEIHDLFHNRYLELIPPSDRQSVWQELTEAMEEDRRAQICYQLKCKDGSFRSVREVSKPVCEEQQWFCCVVMDITGTQAAKDELRLSMERFQIVMEQTSDIIFEWDIREDTLSYSPNWGSKFGYEPIREHFSEQVFLASHMHPDDLPRFSRLMESVRAGKTYSVEEFRIQEAEDRYIWCRVRAVNQYDEAGNAIKAVGVISDIDEDKQKMDTLRRRAERDALTGLYNREETERRIRGYLQERPDEICALFMIDTDNFKQVNDSQGHLFGDAVLTELASGMRKLTRRSDVVGRIGGDEFTIFLKNLPSREIAKEKIAELLNLFQHLFEGEKYLAEVTCSAGIAMYPEDGTDFESLYRCADQALYQAKSQGKNQYVMYDYELVKNIAKTEYSSLRTVIDSDQQPGGTTENLASYVFKMLYESNDMDQAISLILEIVGKRFDVSRTYIFENSDDGRYCDNTYEWCNEGIIPQKENLQHFSYEDLEEYEELFRENAIFYCRDITALLPKQKELFASQGIYSTLQCAIREDGIFQGFVGFDECTGLRMWTKEEVGMLTLISQLLTTFLMKKRATDRDRQIAVQLNAILDMQDAYVYAIDKESFELLYLNHKTTEIAPEVRTGMTCHKAFYDKDKPCKKCALEDTGEFYNPRYGIWTKVQVSPIKWGKKDAYLLSCFDITGYKNMQRPEE